MSEDVAATYHPWHRLVAGSSSGERRLLFELRRICLDAGFDLDHLIDREDQLSVLDRLRADEIQRRLDAAGVWDRLERLVAEMHAAVQSLIVYGPEEEDK